MKFTQENGNDNKKVPIGMHPARCVYYVDLGMQDVEWQGAVSIKQKCLFSFEVPGYEYPLRKEYNVSMFEKANLAIDLTSWFGNFSATDKENFDTKDILNKECTLNVGLNKNGNPKILSILPKTQPVDEAKNSILHFEVEDYKNGNKEHFHALPEWIRNKILDAKELSGDNDNDDDFDDNENNPF